MTHRPHRRPQPRTTARLAHPALAAIAASCLLAAYAGSASAEDKRLGTDATSEEIQNQLMPAEPMFTTRGLGIQNKTASPPRPSSADLEVLFAFGSAELTGQARQILGTLAEALKGEVLSGFEFTVEGHTDAVGPDSTNMQLSRARAESVKRYLIREHGIDPKRLKTIGRGESELLDSSRPDSEVNRRVRVINNS